MASASVMSIMRGTNPLPNSPCKRSASACLRTEPNTRNPFETSTFVVPQPIPVETPVTTTSLLFGIQFLLRDTSHPAAHAGIQTDRGDEAKGVIRVIRGILPVIVQSCLCAGERRTAASAGGRSLGIVGAISERHN